MLSIRLYIVFFFISIHLFAQVKINRIFEYEENPYYWKNKLPKSDYWQQDIHYFLKANLDHQKLIIKGEMELVYINNSPDTLTYLVFHLYQNAFQQGSYYDKLQKQAGIKPVYGYHEKDGLGTVVDSVTCSKGISYTKLDNTILYVYLNKPIVPNEKVIVRADFTTYFGLGNTRRRMKAFRGENGLWHFNGAHWYPRIAVYDEKFGWNTNQHLDKEFYGNFGTFDVELNLPNHHIAEATGVLINEDEVLPKDLKEKLSLENFKDRGNKTVADTLTKTIVYNPKERKIWKFSATNVHDFAFISGPTYRFAEVNCDGVLIKSMVQEKNAKGWLTANDFMCKVLQVYNKDFGLYIYPKLVIADAEDGMEYPMLTLNSGVNPGYRGLLAHEAGHNWFQGMLGTNETYRAFMDEGFTQFLTAWSLNKIDGKYILENPSPNNYVEKYKTPTLVNDMRMFYGYISSVLNYNDAQLNTHSSAFGNGIRHGGGYGHVYYKAACMLTNLQLVLGDDLFLAAMQNYVQQWRVAHPYPEDFRKSIISFTKVDLNWFFDQWLETTNTIDYAVQSVNPIPNKKNHYSINLIRKGKMQMPLDVYVVHNNDSVSLLHIPNTNFIKNTEAQILPKWYTVGELSPKYTFEYQTPLGIKNVIIDTTLQLADVNYLNNSWRLPVEYKLNSMLNHFPVRDKYIVWMRPDIFYNSFDGMQFGVNFKADYLRLLHKIEGNVWMNSGLFQQKNYSSSWLNGYQAFAFKFSYATQTPWLGKGYSISANQNFLNGVYHNFSAIHKKLNKWEFSLGLKMIYIPRESYLNYQLIPDFWNTKKWNNTLLLQASYPYNFAGIKGGLTYTLRSSILSDYDFSYIELNSVNSFKWEKSVWKLRLFSRIGKGSNWAPESMLLTWGANAEEMLDNKWTRAQGAVQKQWINPSLYPGFIHLGGGLNARAFVAYVNPVEKSDGNIHNLYALHSGSAINIEADFTQYLGINPTVTQKYIYWNTYAFGDFAFYNKDNLYVPNSMLADAGLGLSCTVKKWGPLQTVRPTTIRADFPIWVNKVPIFQENHIGFRFLLGIEKAF